MDGRNSKKKPACGVIRQIYWPLTSDKGEKAHLGQRVLLAWPRPDNKALTKTLILNPIINPGSVRAPVGVVTWLERFRFMAGCRKCDWTKPDFGKFTFCVFVLAADAGFFMFLVGYMFHFVTWTLAVRTSAVNYLERIVVAQMTSYLSSRHKPQP